MPSSELERIRGLSEIFAPAASDDRVRLGIGDDAAVLAPSAEPLVWTVDASVDGVHFRRAWLSFEDIGYRATMAAVSDLAAMGAEPLGVLSALVLPEDVRDADLYDLARGQREAAAVCGTSVIGGNLARGRELSVTTTALGRAPNAISRSGARPGDTLWRIGPVGLAAAGLRWLQGGRPLDDPSARRCVEVWRRPRARLAEGLRLRGVASAAIDVSDGLARDTGHLAIASGVIAVIHAAALDRGAPEDIDALRATAAALGAHASDLALSGGEDYALVFTAPPGTHVEDAIEIGVIEALNGRTPAVFIEQADGTREPIGTTGFDHFGR